MSIENPVDRTLVTLRVDGTGYELEYDLHTHTVYSHGTGSIEDNVRAAYEKGLTRIGIADHGPGHLSYGVPRKKLMEMKAEIRRLRPLYPELEILFGVEANILAPQGRLDLQPSEYAYFDFVCAGWHYGALDGLTPGGIAGTFENLIRNSIEKATKRQLRRNTDTIVRALERGGIKFLTHPGDKAPVDLLEIAVCCAHTGTLVEINTSHMSLTAEDLKMMALADIRFIIGSDAHVPERVADFLPAIRLILDAGIDPERVVNLKVV